MCEHGIINIQTDESLNWERVNGLNNNAMLKEKPDLFKYWDFKRNDELNIDIYKVTKGISKKVWWYCDKCNDSYPMSINKKMIDRGCSICSGYYQTKKNSFGGKYPDIAKEWHPTKNGKFPYEYSRASGYNAWWKCSNNPMHQWQNTINNRINGANCPFCNTNNPKTLRGFNDLYTTHPDIAQLLLDSDIGYQYSYGSAKKVKWKCKDCGHINPNLINEMCEYLKCKKCSDRLSLGEKIVYNLICILNIEFYHEKILKWSNKKRYDFYIPSLNAIIEVHGIQHYEQTGRKGARTLKEEQENDKYKNELAMRNGIEHYIVIDARKSNFIWIQNSILKSELSILLNISEKQFNNLDIKANDITTKAWKLWNDGMRVMEISGFLKVSRNAIRHYLLLGNALGKCNYEVEKRYERGKISILKLDLKCNVLEKYDSLIEAKGYNPKKSLQVTTYPFDMIRSKNNDGFIWVYEKELLKSRDLLEEKIREFNLNNNVCQLDKDLNLIKIYNSVTDASKKTGFDYSNIIAVCKNERISCYGYKWMFLYNYENMIKGKCYKKYENSNDKRMKTIVQLSLSGEFIREFENASKANIECEVNSASVTKCCRGERKTAGGFKWMYKYDYEKMIHEN
ncbi:hypothetical protein AMS59_04545 [Lysinibacillus sp. FJAT-14745]|uniref:zinc-ribbon domain-containing protein n=1 Tax=Lysinibacillus sp. FJAT-14745 TaxID=1704289 RepID=UPI0006ABAFA6|nr:zinc-ribbon domain-containing protein [Lysinibacillus sp. FJAT-14745]KOP80647.1 hypothetical protein AMS59_04545 [Lysinibacillus sp. FJAT-14745]